MAPIASALVVTTASEGDPRTVSEGVLRRRRFRRSRGRARARVSHREERGTMSPGRDSFRRVALAAAAFAALAAAATAQLQVGSFVDYERTMYVQVPVLVEGQPFHLELRNVPPTADLPKLIVSLGTDPVDLSAFRIPGALGPDTTQGFITTLDPVTFSLDGVVP